MNDSPAGTHELSRVAKRAALIRAREWMKQHNGKVDSVTVVEFRRIVEKTGWEPTQTWLPAFRQADKFTLWLRKQP